MFDWFPVFLLTHCVKSLVPPPINSAATLSSPTQREVAHSWAKSAFLRPVSHTRGRCASYASLSPLQERQRVLCSRPEFVSGHTWGWRSRLRSRACRCSEVRLRHSRRSTPDRNLHLLSTKPWVVHTTTHHAPDVNPRHRTTARGA